MANAAPSRAEPDLCVRLGPSGAEDEHEFVLIFECFVIEARSKYCRAELVEFQLSAKAPTLKVGANYANSVGAKSICV